MATNMDMKFSLPDARRNDGLCDSRLATVNRIARLAVGDEAGLARLHMISNTGVELSSPMDLQFGQIIRLDLSDTVSKQAIVTANDGDRYAMAFQHRIDCAALLRELVAEARSSRARPLRLATPGMQAEGRSVNGPHKLEAGNISQRGMMVRHDGAFRAGLRVWVHLPNGRECRGVVRWANEGFAGLQWIDILSVNELGALGHFAGN